MHTLEVTTHKGGFSAKCSCGKRLRTVRGANRGGCAYGAAGTWEDYVRHCREAGVKPSPHQFAEYVPS
jgi:hypothetical protein